MVGVCLIGLSFVQYAWQIILLFIIMGFVGLAGPGNLVTTIPVNKWFVKKGKSYCIFIYWNSYRFFNISTRHSIILILLDGKCLDIIIHYFNDIDNTYINLVFTKASEDIGLLPDGEKKHLRKR